MKLYFYWFNYRRSVVYTATAEVTETKKTYKSATDKPLPFMYKSRMLKAELRAVTSNYPGYTCVLDVDDPAAAEILFRDFLNRAHDRAEIEVKRWDGYMKSLEGAEWTEKP